MPRTKRLNQFLKKLLQFSRSDSILTTTSSSNSSLTGSWGSPSTRSCCFSEEEDDGFWQQRSPQSTPEDVPAGCLPVYVGEERRRFVIPTSHLSNSVFRALLEKSEEEYGLRCQGGLRIACAPEAFEHFLWWLDGESTSLTTSIQKF